MILVTKNELNIELKLTPIFIWDVSLHYVNLVNEIEIKEIRKGLF